MSATRTGLKKEYGKLEPIERVRKTKYGWIWRCRCKCGAETEALTSRLKGGRKTSCGCARSERAKNLKRSGSKHRAWRGHGRISGSVWGRVVASAKQRGIPFDLTIEQAWALFERQGGKCALSGVPLHFAASSKELVEGLNTASLDRIDNNDPNGYCVNNVQWIHVDLNYMKSVFPQDKFLEWCGLVTDHQRNLNGQLG